MQVNNVLVDEIQIASSGGPAEVRSTLYEFRDPRWVRVHWEREGRRLGPVTLLDQHEQDIGKLEHFQITEFPPRALHTEYEAVSYRETWTIPPWTVYALVPLKGFVAVRLNARNRGWDHDVPFDLAATPGGGVFYHAIFYGADRAFVCPVEARLERKPDDCQRAVGSAAVVEGTRRFDGLRSAVTRQALSTDFWFKLIDLAGKLF